MKKAKQVLLLALCAVLLVGATIAGTVAYLTSVTTEVKNTFTSGKVHILLDEQDFDKDANTADNVTVSGVVRDRANEYHLIPGGTVTKDPTVWVHEDSEDSYVRMLVTVVKYDKLATAFPKTDATAGYWVDDTFLLQNLVDWNTDWTYAGVTIAADGQSAVYEFRYKEIVDVSKLTSNEQTAAGDTYKALPALFTTITIPGTLTNDQLAALNSVEIDVVAHAIQSNNTGTADEAWAKFAAN